VTEIPEHLLNRSKARRAETSGEAAPASSVPATTSSTPATAASAAPAKSATPAEKKVVPDPPYVKAAKERRKIPFWAMSALALLPVWAFVYLIALKPAEKVAAGPIATGIEVYGSCAGCHGGNGAGGAGQVLYQGEVMKTFPHIEDMLNFVYTGSQQYVAAGLKEYGNPEREGGAHVPLGYNGNPMPQQGQSAGGALSEAEILGVVCHIRYDLSGADPASEEWAAEWENWCSPESPIYPALRAGTTSFETIDSDFASLMPAPIKVGTEPRPGTK
jgi:mono/diheme cytochrome c family protein